MSRHAGVLRDRGGLEGLRKALGRAGPGRQGSPDGTLDLATVEATNLHTVSVLITVAALARAETRGCHRWQDQPHASPAEPARHTIIRVDSGQPRSVPAVQAAARAGA
jgi:L-aspartate oxidase